MAYSSAAASHGSLITLNTVNICVSHSRHSVGQRFGHLIRPVGSSQVMSHYSSGGRYGIGASLSAPYSSGHERPSPSRYSPYSSSAYSSPYSTAYTPGSYSSPYSSSLTPAQRSGSTSSLSSLGSSTSGISSYSGVSGKSVDVSVIA